MDRDFERRWKMINQALDAGIHGTEMQPVVSKRTLFGIPSSVEQGIDKIVAEDEEKYRKLREKQRAQEDESCASAETSSPSASPESSETAAKAANGEQSAPDMR